MLSSGFGQIVHIDTRHFLDAFLTSRKDSAVSGNHIQISVYNDRIDKPELSQAGTKFIDLFSGVSSGVIDVRY